MARKRDMRKTDRRARSKVWMYAECLNWASVVGLTWLFGMLTPGILVVTTVWIFGKYIYCYMLESIMKIKHNRRGVR